MNTVNEGMVAVSFAAFTHSYAGLVYDISCYAIISRQTDYSLTLACIHLSLYIL